MMATLTDCCSIRQKGRFGYTLAGGYHCAGSRCEPLLLTLVLNSSTRSFRGGPGIEFDHIVNAQYRNSSFGRKPEALYFRYCRLYNPTL
mmetsp:Transcript_31197/g.93586  ORF Transcript_31197/g.93586 Transcript_31197/m.93586 type:complete len:89 (-) Transcript_31197:1549-1815(-)